MKILEGNLKIIIICIIISALVGALAGYAVANMPKNDAAVYSDFYAVETAVSISPTDFVKDLQHGTAEGLAVDLRSAADYKRGHLVTAINIPATQMTEAQVVEAFKALPKDKQPITYCYSSYCMLSRKVGNLLAQNGIYVKHFTAGGYEIARDLNAFVVTGENPGTIDVNGTISSDICNINTGGELGC